ncbi:MAG: T9SS type A sorting domain-containing protein [Bacteroidetes bacterium]|nr:T9SS type A sorting domain-containing protein [Bacteroidota bacterium]
MKKQILALFGLAILGVFLVSFANAQTTHVVFVGNGGFSPDLFVVNVGDEVQFKLDLANNSGTHYSTSTNIPNGASSWNYAMYCSTCAYTVIVTDPGTYDFVDANSSLTGSFSTSPTGLKENDNNSNSLNIYPNPVQGNSFISYNLGSVDGQIIITNILGEQLNIYTLSDKSGQITINDDLPQGLYFCTLWDKNSVVSQKKMMVIK